MSKKQKNHRTIREKKKRRQKLLATRRDSGVARAKSLPSSSLEYLHNVVTEEGVSDQLFEVTTCGCNCWYCDGCSERKGYNLRAELIPILETFRNIMMITLTVDPELFSSPRDAYMYIRKNRAISRLVRDLNRWGHLLTPRYFCVIEFQRETEHVHFHILIDASHVPKTAIDAAWSKFRPTDAGPVKENRPAFGMTRFSMPRFEGGAVHAGRYATKYLVKPPKQDWPQWVLEMGDTHRVPRYQTSRSFWNRPRKNASVGESEARETSSVTYAKRRNKCGTSCNLFVTKVWTN